jgi:hypothetical protein
LHQHLRSDDLDIIVATMPTARMPYLSRAWVEQPIWAAAESFSCPCDRPMPLGAHLEGCDYRSRMIDALDAANGAGGSSIPGPAFRACRTRC